MLMAEEKQMEGVEDAERLYKRIADKIENPTYEIKHKVYSLLIDKVILKKNNAEVWLNVPKEFAIPQFVSGLNSQNLEEMGGMLRTPYKKRSSPTRSRSGQSLRTRDG